MFRAEKLKIPYNVKSIFFWALGITLFLSLGLFIPLGFSASSCPRLIIAIFTPAIVVVGLKTASLNLPCWFKEKWIVSPLFLSAIVLMGQWFIFGTTFSWSGKNYRLDKENCATLPIFGSYAYLDGKNIKAKRSYFSEEVEIDTSFNSPKAIGISLFGDRIAVRFHSSDYPGGTGKGVRVFYSTKKGERIGSSSSNEKGYWHSPLYLIW